jgi:hypothetical protein
MYELTSQQLKKQPIQIRNEGKSDICGRYTTMETVRSVDLIILNSFKGWKNGGSTARGRICSIPYAQRENRNEYQSVQLEFAFGRLSPSLSKKDRVVCL